VISPGGVRPGLFLALSGNNVILGNQLLVGGLNVIQRDKRSIGVSSSCAIAIYRNHSIATVGGHVQIIAQRRALAIPAHQQIVDVNFVPL
jgi:hypothetical protein